ncbi:unnamed protein product [Cochlearia groenlandica]
MSSSLNCAGDCQGSCTNYQDAVLRMPPLRLLCLILKVFLQQRELNEVYSDGTGSYALLAVLIAFLKYLKDGRSTPEHNLGVLLSFSKNLAFTYFILC